jgi:hypothetical protein
VGSAARHGFKLLSAAQIPRYQPRDTQLGVPRRPGRTPRPAGRRPRFSCLPARCWGLTRPAVDVVNAATIQGQNKVISVSTGHGVRGTRESLGCVRPQLARCAVLARATIRSRLEATLSKNDARATSLDAASDRSDQDRARETSWHHTRIRGLPDGWIPVTRFRSNPNPKIRPYSYSILTAAHQPCDRPHEIDQCTNMDFSFPPCC